MLFSGLSGSFTTLSIDISFLDLGYSLLLSNPINLSFALNDLLEVRC